VLVTQIPLIPKLHRSINTIYFSLIASHFEVEGSGEMFGQQGKTVDSRGFIRRLRADPEFQPVAPRLVNNEEGIAIAAAIFWNLAGLSSFYFILPAIVFPCARAYVAHVVADGPYDPRAAEELNAEIRPRFYYITTTVLINLIRLVAKTILLNLSNMVGRRSMASDITILSLFASLAGILIYKRSLLSLAIQKCKSCSNKYKFRIPFS
jgi:hypothetical protein